MHSIPFIQVGVGNRGAAVMQDFFGQKERTFRPVALVDVVPRHLEAACQTGGVAADRCYRSLTEALARTPDAEAVVIVTPAQFHGKLIREALEAGRHVWVEKPLTYDYDEACALAELAKAVGKVVVVGNQYQYAPIERRLQRMIASGTYGRPYLVTYRHHRYRPDMRAFTGPLPALWEQGVHSLDSVLAMLGHPEIESVYAASIKPSHSRYNGESVTTIQTTFANGVLAQLLLTFDSQQSDWEIRVECEMAALVVPAQGWARDQVIVLQGEKEVERLGPLPEQEIDPREAGPATAFHAAITEGFKAPTDISTNLATIQWIDAVVRSCEEKRVVEGAAAPMALAR